ncbi:unnamed protein product, partial [Allacma fusca]
CHIFKLSECIQLSNPIVTLESGSLKGRGQVSRGGRTFASFEGIPYAVAERFEPPVEPESWQGIRDATRPGNLCPQYQEMTQTYICVTEDCLFLNVFVPTDNQSQFSVNLTTMFYIHGGAYISGGGSIVGPNYFMDEDVILITINYRLGALGFLNTGDGLVTGNMGFKDMILALQWVQKNIQQFGGNPGKVTIFGESVGGAAAHSLMLCTAAKGLFHSVIAQSGSALNSWNVVPDPAETYRNFLERLCCNGLNNSLKLECLKNESIWNIIQEQKIYQFGPTIDKNVPAGDYSVFPEPMETLIQSGDNSKHLPLMIGRVEMELLGTALMISKDNGAVGSLNENWTSTLLSITDYSFFVQPEDSIERVSQSIRDFYFQGRHTVTNGTIDRISLEQLLTDFYFFWGLRNAALLSTKAGSEVYAYTFKYNGPFGLLDYLNVPEEEQVGPIHADEMQYLFNSLQEPQKRWPDIKEGSKDGEFSKMFVHLWVSFARDGVPDATAFGKNWDSIPKHKGNDLDSVVDWYIIDYPPKAGPETEDKYLQERAKFWNHIFERNGVLPVLHFSMNLLVLIIFLLFCGNLNN